LTATNQQEHHNYANNSLSLNLINAQHLPAHRSAADDNFLIGCTGHDLTDDWSLASTHFVDSLCPFRCSFGCVLLLNQIYLITVYHW